MYVDWDTDKPHAALESHGKGFVDFKPLSVRSYAEALHLPKLIANRLAAVNSNLSESMLALRWKYGFVDKVFLNLLIFSNSWSTLPESMPEWDEVHSRCTLRCCNRELSYQYDLKELYKPENRGLIKDTLLLAVVNAHQFNNIGKGVVQAPLEDTDKVRKMPA